MWLLCGHKNGVRLHGQFRRKSQSTVCFVTVTAEIIGEKRHLLCYDKV